MNITLELHIHVVSSTLALGGELPFSQVTAKSKNDEPHDARERSVGDIAVHRP